MCFCFSEFGLIFQESRSHFLFSATGLVSFKQCLQISWWASGSMCKTWEWNIDVVGPKFSSIIRIMEWASWSSRVLRWFFSFGLSVELPCFELAMNIYDKRLESITVKDQNFKLAVKGKRVCGTGALSYCLIISSASHMMRLRWTPKVL